MRIAVYPGTFDPVTNGHIDIIERALKLFDKLYVLVGNNPNKESTFTAKERVDMLKSALKKHNHKIQVEFFDGLLLNYVRKKKSNVIVRGLRAISDFEFEFQRAQFNREFAKDIETIFIMTKDDYAFLSSSIIKEIAMFHGSVKGFVPENVEKKLKEKFKK
ncbi:pantetheine-phosphate adenylyltransferase [Candidatus Woesearchaeota archaeon]|jgi:pantetheine-phosphate adenylyltransferase|nr:pantetheine-phosphate adenylyltransferase [Candidatus Woesearchaeota archaeon]MDP6648331.1 pantetheine-phosphate adenylyltransferase [Candidatus Woesearchaeota archaeon]|tara:strand:- start:2336 stop:2818 length:483 start_codon:yes stop_codon:yes gene_type:complete